MRTTTHNCHLLSRMLAKLPRLGVILLDLNKPSRTWMFTECKRVGIQIATIYTHRERVVVRIN